MALNGILSQAAVLFDRADYWEVHEYLEPHWLAAESWDRDLLAGIILLASAMYKTYRQSNPRAGRRLFARGAGHLAWLPDTYRGVDIRALELDVHAALLNPSYRPAFPFVETIEPQWFE